MMTRKMPRTRAAALLAGAVAASVVSGCSAEGASVQGRDAVGSATADTAAHHADASSAHSRGRRAGLATARAASANWHRVEEAVADGYGLPPSPAPLHECISATEGSGAMGLHYINGDNVADTVLDPSRPAALVYEPTKHGGVQLVALEYVVFADAWQAAHPNRKPRLFGRELTLVPDGNRYELPAFYQIHAWAWKHNPHGRFADHNPRVSCRFADRLPD